VALRGIDEHEVALERPLLEELGVLRSQRRERDRQRDRQRDEEREPRRAGHARTAYSETGSHPRSCPS
jgi:hypothetical protein